MKNKIIAVLLLLIASVISSCGSARPESYPTPAPQPFMAVPEEQMEMEKSSYDSYDNSYDFGAETPSGYTGVAGAEAGAGAESVAQEDQKIIKTAVIRAETKDLDGFDKTINGLLTTYGGYMEYSDVSIYDSEKNLKNGNYTLRVPSEYYDALKQGVIESCKVLSQNSSSDNATTEYKDTEARVATKKAEENRLLEMIEKAEKIEDLILLEQRLSNVRTEIELYESRLKNIDRLASFSTIRVSISEVKEETVKEISGTDLFSRMKGSFNASINFIISVFETIVILLSGIILPLSIIAIPVIVIILVLRTNNKRKKNKIEKGDSNEKNNNF